MKGFALTALLCLLGMVYVPHATAQGVIRGAVVDSLSNETLPGANVIVRGTALGGATDFDGQFRIAAVPSGSQVLVVSYLGFQSREIPVTVRSGETMTLTIRLLPAAVQSSGEVVVTAQFEGQAAAVNQQLTSNTIVNVVSEERIRELPDANAAESLGRLPGVSVQRSGGEANQVVLRGLSGGFASITVDGVKIPATDPDARGLDLSAISQGTLAGIELFKALTPDKDGDAIAGSINLVTRRAPAQREVRADFIGSYNHLAGDFGQYDVDMRYGERFLRGVLGVQLSANVEQRNRSSQQYDLDYRLEPVEAPLSLTDNLYLNYVDETRRRYGFGIILDASTPDDGWVKLSTQYNHTSRDYATYERDYPLSGDIVYYSARDRELRIGLLNTALTGENHLFGFDANWGASLSRSASQSPYDYEFTFTEPSITANGEVISGMGQFPDSVRVGDPALIDEYAINNFDRTFLWTAQFRDELNTDRDLAAYLDLSRDFTVGRTVSAQIKVGGKYRVKSRNRDRSEVLSPYYNENFPAYVMLDDGTVVAKELAGTRFENLEKQGERILVTNFLDADPRGENLFDRFYLFPLVNRDAMREWWNLNQNGYLDANGRTPEYRENLEPQALYYDLTERVSAAYTMGTLNLGQRITLLGGVRVEREDNDYTARNSREPISPPPNTAQASPIVDTTATYRETIWLPNAHLTVRPTNFLTVRLAAYRALARPDYNRRLPTVVARQTGFFYSGNSLTLGNPNLRAAKAWNYEANASVFNRFIGLFSVSVFYKDIEDYFHTINNQVFTGNSVFDSLGIDQTSPFGTSRFGLTVPFNSAQPTTVRGIEVDHQMNLHYLPGPLSGLVAGYNITALRSSTFVPRVRVVTTYIERPPFPPIPQVAYVPYESEQKLQQQPDFVANLSLGYDYRAFSVRVSMFHQRAYFTSFSGSELLTSSDAERGGFTRWDLAFKQGIGRRLALLLNLNNLTNVEETRYNNYSQLGYRRVNNSELYGTTVDFGLRLSL